MVKMFPVIDLEATGENITRLRKDRGLTVRDLQNWFGFEEPQAIYKWQRAKACPPLTTCMHLVHFWMFPWRRSWCRASPN